MNTLFEQFPAQPKQIVVGVHKPESLKYHLDSTNYFRKQGNTIKEPRFLLWLEGDNPEIYGDFDLSMSKTELLEYTVMRQLGLGMLSATKYCEEHNPGVCVYCKHTNRATCFYWKDDNETCKAKCHYLYNEAAS